MGDWILQTGHAFPKLVTPPPESGMVWASAILKPVTSTVRVLNHMSIFDENPRREQPSGRLRSCPTEQSEQLCVVRWLRKKQVTFFHVPNGGRRVTAEAKVLKSLGVRAGVPDLIIIDPPPVGGYVGAVAEMKRQRGGRLDPDQKVWLDLFRARGWAVEVCDGATVAIEWLESLGYGSREPSVAA